jgi:glutamate-1-semialdehyde 2,1-aminomutase
MSTSALASASLAERYAAEFRGSRKLHEQARKVFPDGVTHDLRYMEPFPIYIDRAAGAYKWDVDDHQLIDYWSGHGALLLGHSYPAVVEAVQQQAARATHPGACHALEIEWGQWVQRLIPSAERVRFTSSGTEATMMALRLARIFTGRPRVLKFAGHFHGWNDFLAPDADPPYGEPFPGVLAEVRNGTVVIRPNEPEELERTLASDPDIGCVILEPTGGHWGQVPIKGPFLHALREITRKHARLLIFDEVITGFRVSPGGAQGHYGIVPDLTTLAKVLAGGLPGGCVAGRADVLASLEFRAGKGKMRHQGTFNANPLSASAGIATLKEVATGEPSRQASATGKLLRERLNALFEQREIDWVAYGEFSGFRLLAGYEGPRPRDDSFVPYEGNFERLDAPIDPQLRRAFRQAMLLHGVDLPGLSGMTSMAHGEADIEQTVAAVSGTIDLLKAEGPA